MNDHSAIATARKGPGTAAPKKITGDTVNTAYGPVVVTITVTGDKITDITAKLPNTGDSAAIAANAGPKLKQQALEKQIAEAAQQSTLKERAKKNTQAMLESMLHQLGFERVTILWAPEP